MVESVHSPADYKRILIKASYLSIGVTVPIATILYIFTPSILGIFGEGYVDNVSALFRLMIITSPFVVINMVWLSYLRTKMFIKEIITSSFLMVLIAVGIPYLFLDDMGLDSIGWGWIISQILVLIS